MSRFRDGKSKSQGADLQVGLPVHGPGAREAAVEAAEPTPRPPPRRNWQPRHSNEAPAPGRLGWVPAHNAPRFVMGITLPVPLSMSPCATSLQWQWDSRRGWQGGWALAGFQVGAVTGLKGAQKLPATSGSQAGQDWLEPLHFGIGFGELRRGRHPSPPTPRAGAPTPAFKGKPLAQIRSSWDSSMS